MSIKVSFHHQLHYRYNRPIILGPQTLGLRPAPHCRTPIQSYSLKIEPKNHSLYWQQDPYGNYLARVNFPDKTEFFNIDVDLIAQLQPINPFNFVLESYASHYPFQYEPQLRKELIPFLEIVESGQQLQTWINNNQQQDIYTPDFLTTINQTLAQKIQYKTRLEPGIQTCEETLKKRLGSCRDTAWLLVQILRHYGLAARFASGYLIQLQPDIPSLDQENEPKQDQGDLHAWAEVYLPGAGWIGLDPTSGFLTAEGHLPLVCTAEPQAANPVQGTAEPSESELEFAVIVSRYQDNYRPTKPYTESQWQQILTLGNYVENRLQNFDISLTMGGEPTFVSIDDFESPQWRIEALGEEKLNIARKLIRRLEKRFTKGKGLLHEGLGKWYPGEALPRWSLGCYWQAEAPIWQNKKWLVEVGDDQGYTQFNAEQFIETLAQHLGINETSILPAYEAETEALAGYVLPLLPVKQNNTYHWITCNWQLPQDQLILSPGDSPIGFRLPLDQIEWPENLETEAILPPDFPCFQHQTETPKSALNSIRVALTIEAKQGKIRVFLPPISSARCYLDLITAIEKTAESVQIPVIIQGYAPPKNQGIIGFQITPDPGVIEVNIHPAANWQELVHITTILYEEARLCRLGTEKYLLNGRHVSTGGGSHITIGGQTVKESPLLKRPDLLRSFISYWQNHPSLSYLFSGLFVGATSQSPRVDEARHESLYELEIAFQFIKPQQKVAPEVVDQLFRHLLVDVTGNTHRTAFCIDKLFPVNHIQNQLGLLEFRGFAMAPHSRMSLLQLLLIRACVAWFWEKPYLQPLIRWGTTLHDRFMLPHFIREDLNQVIIDLNQAGFEFELDWFTPFFEFRFPQYGEMICEGIRLELRHAIEPWLVLGEEVSHQGTSRYVDDSMERIQVLIQGAMGNSSNLDHFSQRYQVLCNGQIVPLKSTGNLGEYVGGVRFRARQNSAVLHPAIQPHHPLLFEIIDTWSQRSIGGCSYYVTPPNGITYQTFPLNSREAESRQMERFIIQGHTEGKIDLPPLVINPESPLTLDLRRAQ